LIGLCLSSFVLQAQAPSGLLKVEIVGEAHRKLDKLDGRTYSLDEKDEVEDFLMLEAIKYGHLRAKIEEESQAETVTLILRVNESYRWTSIGVSEETEEYIRKAGYNIKRIKGKQISPTKLAGLMESTLQQLENGGYPFAELRLDSVEIDKGQVGGYLVLNKGPFVRIDSVVINGNLKIRKTYLTNVLGISEGSPYNEKRISEMRTRLSDLSFVEEVAKPTVQFEKDETRINLFLNKRPSSKFDGIIGFLPDDVTGKLLVVGDATLHLENALKQGEVFHLEWKKLQTNTQQLSASAIAPFLLNSPVTLDGEIGLYRRDTSYTDVNREAGLRYVFGANDYLRLYVDRQTSNLISTSAYQSGAATPEFLDRAITLYGAGVQLENLNQRLNPSKGFALNAETGVGQRNIIKNQNLPELLYDSLQLKSLFVNSSARFEYFIPITNRFVWHQRFSGANILNDEILVNEAQRIGGLKSIRGFDEQSIFATSHVIARSEMRYRLENQSYAFVFFDGAWYENLAVNRTGVWRDLPFGTGMGMSFTTKAGVFSLVYALGSQQNNPLQLRASKIHFGFLSVF